MKNLNLFLVAIIALLLTALTGCQVIDDPGARWDGDCGDCRDDDDDDDDDSASDDDDDDDTASDDDDDDDDGQFTCADIEAFEASDGRPLTQEQCSWHSPNTLRINAGGSGGWWAAQNGAGRNAIDGGANARCWDRGLTIYVGDDVDPDNLRWYLVAWEFQGEGYTPLEGHEATMEASNGVINEDDGCDFLVVCEDC